MVVREIRTIPRRPSPASHRPRPQKPVELPQRPFCAIQPACKGASCERLRFQDDKANQPKWFLRMPAIGSPLDADEKWALKPLLAVVCPQVQARNMAFHDFASID